MDLDDLHIFRTVAREGGITRAATRLHRVQSNVTTRIRQLEANLGQALFLREGKGLVLAPAGHILLDYADRILDLAAAARAAVNADTPQGLLRLGSMESTAAARLPPILSRYHRNHAAVRLTLQTGPSAELLRELRAGHLDCVLVAGPIGDPHLAQFPIYGETLVLVAPLSHPPIYHPADVGPRTLLAFQAGCTYRQRLESWFAESDVVPDQVVELSSYHAMIGCAAAGMGVAVVPISLLARLPDADQISQHALPPATGESTTFLVHRRGLQPPSVAALLTLLQEDGKMPTP